VAEAALSPDPSLDALQAMSGAVHLRREIGELVVNVAVSDAFGFLKKLRDEFGFAQVMDICGVDFPAREARFDVVYNLLSITRNDRIRVIVQTDPATPVASVSALWPNATWWEREVWDLFGVRFEGLADHRRILTDYGFEGHPLRKDFPLTGYLEVHYDQERKSVVYDNVKLTQEFRNFDFLSPWEGMTSLPGDEKARSERR
jgi:NADH-quinone oxidoreductase subunit C